MATTSRVAVGSSSPDWTLGELGIMVLPDSTSSLTSHPGLMANNTLMEKELMADLIGTADNGVSSTVDMDNAMGAMVTLGSSAMECTPSSSEMLTLNLEDGSVLQLCVQSLDKDLEAIPIAQEVILPFDNNDDAKDAKMSKRRLRNGRRGMPSLESLKKSLLIDSSNSAVSDLEALLLAAKVRMELNELVEPSLAVVKRRMHELRLSEWQTQLCIKIRRRMKNTAAVRSSRQKRSAYVSELRDRVQSLEQRRVELQEEKLLLTQLRQLWHRLVNEVKAELQQGITNSNGNGNSNSNSNSISNGNGNGNGNEVNVEKNVVKLALVDANQRIIVT